MSDFLVPVPPEGAPRLFLVGPSGSGKTVIGERAAQMTGWHLYDTDAEVLRMEDATAIGDIFDTKGELHFRRLELACLRAVSAIDAKLIVATGGGLPAIPGAMDRMQQLGLSVYLRASVETLWMRLQMDPPRLAERPLLRTNGEQALRSMLHRRESIYMRSSLILDTDTLSVDEVCRLIATQLASMDERRTG